MTEWQQILKFINVPVVGSPSSDAKVNAFYFSSQRGNGLCKNWCKRSEKRTLEHRGQLSGKRHIYWAQKAENRKAVTLLIQNCVWITSFLLFSPRGQWRCQERWQKEGFFFPDCVCPFQSKEDIIFDMHLFLGQFTFKSTISAFHELFRKGLKVTTFVDTTLERGRLIT